MMTSPLTSNAEQILRRLGEFPARMAAAVAAAMALENQHAIAHIQQTKLSQRGPETLGVVSNRLRSSVNDSKPVVNGDTITSAIGSPMPYAAAHEFGFSGPVQVAAHRRVGGSGDLFKINGAIITRTRAQRLGLLGKRGSASSKYAERKKISQTFGMVRAHTRNVNIKARHMFERGIEECGPNYGAAISQAIVTTWEAK